MNEKLEEEAYLLSMIHRRVTPPLLMRKFKITYQLEWDKVKDKYQGIIIAPYQWECRLALETCWYYGWDCASGCIWDLDCIKEFIKQEVHV